MFYSSTLLNQTGPLAKAWLSANQEKKVSKNAVILHNLPESVKAIIQPAEAPLALRLSGQLLLGVVRIYGRKAGYLLDDCNEAIHKIQMAFHSTSNHDLPDNMQAMNKESLILQDRITPYDIEMSMSLAPNPALFDMRLDALPASQRSRNNRDINLQEDHTSSQFFSQDTFMEDDVLVAGVDLNLDFGAEDDETPMVLDKSVEMGRDAPRARSAEGDMSGLDDFDVTGPSKDRNVRQVSLGLDLDFGDLDDFGGRSGLDHCEDNVRIADADGDIRMGDDTDFQLQEEPSILHEQQGLTPVLRNPSRERISLSPLSDVDIDPETSRRMEAELSRGALADIYEPVDDDVTIIAPQRLSKKKKALQPDDQTMLSSAHIKENQNNRDLILKKRSYIPRDMRLHDLQKAQKKGEFAFYILGEKRSEAWAPELRGLLSLNALWPHKRKRNSGITDMECGDENGAAVKSPRLDIPDEQGEAVTVESAFGGRQREAADASVFEMAGDDGVPFQDNASLQDTPDPVHSGNTPGREVESVAPAVHPAEIGPISIGTKHAVYFLRDLLGADAETSESARKKSAIVFQEVLPEGKTTKAEATRMFFECLVLGTKDAIKIEQSNDTLGGPIRIRGKRGLWGEWAERDAGGQMGQQDEPEPEHGASRGYQHEEWNAPEHAMAHSSAIAVEAW